jgi:hypothetical protein
MAYSRTTRSKISKVMALLDHSECICGSGLWEKQDKMCIECEKAGCDHFCKIMGQDALWEQEYKAVRSRWQ